MGSHFHERIEWLKLGIVINFYKDLDGLKRLNDNEETMVRKGKDNKALTIREHFYIFPIMDGRTPTVHTNRFEQLRYHTRLTILHGH